MTLLTMSLIKLELTIVIDVLLARSHGKESSFRKIAELARHSARNYSAPPFPISSLSLSFSRSPPCCLSLLPSAITNEPPVIENNRCVRVMLPEDRVLLATSSIYEPVESTSTSSTGKRCGSLLRRSHRRRQRRRWQPAVRYTRSRSYYPCKMSSNLHFPVHSLCTSNHCIHPPLHSSCRYPFSPSSKEETLPFSLPLSQSVYLCFSLPLLSSSSSSSSLFLSPIPFFTSSSGWFLSTFLARRCLIRILIRFMRREIVRFITELRCNLDWI